MALFYFILFFFISFFYFSLQAFELCESLNAVGTVLDLHKLLENKKASAMSKVAVLEALGEVSKAAGA